MSTIQSALIMAFGVVGMNYFFKLVHYLTTRKSSVFTKNNYKQDSYVFIVYFTGFYIFYSILDTLESKQFDIELFTLLLIFISQLLLVSIPYIILPLFYLIRSKRNNRNNELETWVQSKFGKSYKVVILDIEVTNAYAAGILPIVKVILLGKPLVEKLSKPELEAIIAHEVGHLVENHLLRLYVNQIFLGCLVAFGWTKISSNIHDSPYYVWILSAYFGILLGGLSVLINGFIQKKLEKAADRYAAKMTSPQHIISALNKLNIDSEGAMEKWSFNYPTLNERIKYVEAI